MLRRAAVAARPVRAPARAPPRHAVPLAARRGFLSGL